MHPVFAYPPTFVVPCRVLTGPHETLSRASDRARTHTGNPIAGRPMRSAQTCASSVVVRPRTGASGARPQAWRRLCRRP
jgi:hypothetical protein